MRELITRQHHVVVAAVEKVPGVSTTTATGCAVLYTAVPLSLDPKFLMDSVSSWVGPPMLGCTCFDSSFYGQLSLVDLMFFPGSMWKY